jgi:PPOX class probable F420-dependent enzyme
MARSAVAMTDDEMFDFLEAPRSLILATHGPGGRIHQVAMWYGIMDGVFVMSSFARSQKVVNLRRDQRYSCLAEDGSGYAELRGVQFDGVAEIVEEPGKVLEIVTFVSGRYMNESSPATAERAARGRVAMLLRPGRFASWDHRKLAGTY